jgi:transcriptional regulator with XRE-family HTH domain
MRITAITKFKQGDIYNAMRQLGWSQSELARRCLSTPGTIGLVMNMRQRPSARLAGRIQKAFATEGVFIDILTIWPEGFKGFKKSPVHELTKEVDLAGLLQARDSQLYLDVHKKEMTEAVDGLLDMLPDRQRKMVERQFINGERLSDIARDEGVTPTSIKNRVGRALRKFWDPSRKTRESKPFRMAAELMLPNYEELR